MVWNLSTSTAVDEKMANTGIPRGGKRTMFSTCERPFPIASTRTGRRVKRYSARPSSVGVSDGNQRVFRILHGGTHQRPVVYQSYSIAGGLMQLSGLLLPKAR